ncbi:MAG: 2OG-Fe dioxygenase family protein [Alphaproteobacteria bacterium]|nr:2OG-Fe dioxygenase family protein [Alphaproteobacteria bacterium]
MRTSSPSAAATREPGRTLLSAIERRGYAFLEADAMWSLLAAAGSLDDWAAFAASWNDLALDTYMADGGRYRRRRHAIFTARAGAPIARAPHGPHFQSLDYNTLNGGIERWFEPIGSVGEGASMTAILEFCRATFEALVPAIRAWHIETHQFRIEARCGEVGRPTPEGMHRDGVDYVLVLLIRRQNIRRGTTSIHALDRRHLGSFTLTNPFDAALVHDARVYHGVTPVEPVDPTAPAYRDVLVVTFKGK